MQWCHGKNVMGRRTMRWALLLTLLLSTAPAWGQDDLDRRDCQSANADVAIKGCTRLLESGRLDASARRAALMQRAYKYGENDEFRRAIRDYDAAIAIDARQASAFYFRGAMHLRLKQHRRAIDDFSKAVALEPEFDLAYGLRGDAHSGLGDYRRAIADYDTALRIKPGLDHFYCRRGKAHEGLRNREAAIGDFRRGLEWDASSAECQAGLKRLGAQP